MHSVPSKPSSRNAQATENTHNTTHNSPERARACDMWCMPVCVCAHTQAYTTCQRQAYDVELLRVGEETGYVYMRGGRKAAPGRLSVCSVAGRNFLCPARAHIRCSGCERNTQTRTCLSGLFGDAGRRLECPCGSSSGVCIVINHKPKILNPKSSCWQLRRQVSATGAHIGGLVSCRHTLSRGCSHRDSPQIAA